MLATRDAQVREWLDEATLDDAALRRNLRDIRRINALLGWTSFAVREIGREVLARHRDGFALLDVATGSADIPLALARWAAHRGIPARIVATDLSPQIVRIATQETAAMPSITVQAMDALAPNFAPGSFDIALCTLALHHFEPPLAIELLRNLGQLGRRVIVFDVERHPLAYLGVIPLTRIIPMDAMTRHDAPVSVRRAYDQRELGDLAIAAGLRDAQVRVGFPFRMMLTARGLRD
jgi:2-polyprenyl-3-methyl-5-hydroxy-6-metoxy-1,4-benzoquinol methylase